MQIINVPPQRATEAGRLVADAFASEPIMQHAIPDARRRRFPHTILLRQQVAGGGPWMVIRGVVSGHRLVGIAFWHLVGTRARGPFHPGLVRAARKTEHFLGPHAAAWNLMGDSLLRHLHDDRCWYLTSLAVHPDAQRAGIGRALLRDGLAQADAGAHAVFLQTSTLVNVRFYEGEGFKVLWKDDELYPGAPPLWSLRRDGGARPSWTRRLLAALRARLRRYRLSL